MSGNWAVCGVCEHRGFVGAPDLSGWPERRTAYAPMEGIERRYEARGGRVYACRGCGRAWWLGEEGRVLLRAVGDLREWYGLSDELLEQVTGFGVGQTFTWRTSMLVPCQVQRKTGEWVRHAVLVFEPGRMGVCGLRETGQDIATVAASEDALPLAVRNARTYLISRHREDPVEHRVTLVRRRGWRGRFEEPVALVGAPQFFVGGGFAAREAVLTEVPAHVDWQDSWAYHEGLPWVTEPEDVVYFECEAGREWFEQWEQG